MMAVWALVIAQALVPTHGHEMNIKRWLAPDQVCFTLVNPSITVLGQVKVKVPYNSGEDQTHLSICQTGVIVSSQLVNVSSNCYLLFAQAVSRPKRERLERFLRICGEPRIILPSFRYKGFW